MSATAPHPPTVTPERSFRVLFVPFVAVLLITAGILGIALTESGWLVVLTLVGALLLIGVVGETIYGMTSDGGADEH